MNGSRNIPLSFLPTPSTRLPTCKPSSRKSKKESRRSLRNLRLKRRRHFWWRLWLTFVMSAPSRTSVSLKSSPWEPRSCLWRSIRSRWIRTSSSLLKTVRLTCSMSLNTPWDQSKKLFCPSRMPNLPTSKIDSANLQSELESSDKNSNHTALMESLSHQMRSSTSLMRQ